MKLFRVLLDVITFGITVILRWLVKKKHLKRQIDIDIDADGSTDVRITFEGSDIDGKSEEEECQRQIK